MAEGIATFTGGDGGGGGSGMKDETNNSNNDDTMTGVYTAWSKNHVQHFPCY